MSPAPREMAVQTAEASREGATDSAEIPLAELLRIIDDESLDLKIRFKAAKVALAAKYRDSLTIQIVKYGDMHDQQTPRPVSNAISPRLPQRSRFYFDCFWRPLEVSPAAIECADQVMATIKQEAQEKIEVENLVVYMRANGVTLEDMLDKVDTQ